jgi:hypothetical protein
MRALARTIGVSAIMLCFATGCGSSSGPAAVGPTASPSVTSASSPTTTASAVAPLRYHLDAPANWSVTRAWAPWTGNNNVPGPGDPTVDTFKSPEADPWFVITMMPAGGERNLQRWIKARVADHTITFSSAFCGNQVNLERSAMLGGEKAMLRGFNCPPVGPSAVAVQIISLHGGDAWFVMCGSESRFGKPLTAFSKQCEHWLSNFRFA